MIRKIKKEDINEIMEIWLNINIKTHNFIPNKYWKDNFDIVKEILPQSEVYVYEDCKNKICGFIGLQDNYIAGIFIKEKMQSKGIGKELLNFVKNIKTELTLNVYEKNIKAVKFYKRENFIIENKNIDEMTKEKEFFMKWKK